MLKLAFLGTFLAVENMRNISEQIFQDHGDLKQRNL